jgi:hypothetical protein
MSPTTLKRAIFFTLLIISGALFADTLTVTADRTTISANETVQIKVRFDEQVIFGDLDMEPLKKDFAVLNSSRQQQYSNVNGKTISYTDWNITLQPKSKSKGTLIIPALDFKGATSNSVTIKVTEAKQPTSGQQGESVFLESEISHQSVYVQQQLILTYRLYMAVALQNLTMSEFNPPTVDTHKLDESRYQKDIGGINYQVIEISFALFPQSSGELIIPSAQFAGYIPTGRSNPFFNTVLNNGKRFNLLGDEYRIEVKAKSAQATDHWLPATALSLDEKWSGDVSEWRAGEPITRTIIINAQGVTANQLPKIKVAEQDQFRVYPDQPTLQEEARPAGMVAQRVEAIAFVPAQAGDVELPAVSVQWWDTTNNQLRTATLPSKIINVKPSNNQSYSPQVAVQPQNPIELTEPTDEQQSASMWLKISIALNALLLLFVLRLMQRKPNAVSDKTPTQSSTNHVEKDLFNAILQSVKANNPQRFQHNILRWVNHRWPDESLTTLADVAQFSGNSELHQQFTELSDNLYSRSTESIDLATIATNIKKMRANGFTQLNRKSARLEGLYPEQSITPR